MSKLKSVWLYVDEHLYCLIQISITLEYKPGVHKRMSVPHARLLGCAQTTIHETTLRHCLGLFQHVFSLAAQGQIRPLEKAQLVCSSSSLDLKSFGSPVAIQRRQTILNIVYQDQAILLIMGPWIGVLSLLSKIYLQQWHSTSKVDIQYKWAKTRTKRLI